MAHQITDPAERDTLLAEIRAALIDYYGDPITVRPDADWGEVRDTVRAREAQSERLRTLINGAVSRGITHRQISSATQWPGRMILGWITDDDARAAAGQLEAHHLEREAELLRADRQRDAYAQSVAGTKGKTEIAKSFGISRMTLNTWIRRYEKQMASAW